MDKDSLKLMIRFMSIYPLGGGIAGIIMWLFPISHNVPIDILWMGFGFIGGAALLNFITVIDETWKKVE